MGVCVGITFFVQLRHTFCCTWHNGIVHNAQEMLSDCVSLKNKKISTLSKIFLNFLRHRCTVFAVFFSV